MSGRQDVGFRRTFPVPFDGVCVCVCLLCVSWPSPAPAWAPESLAKHLSKLIVSLRIVFDRSGAERSGSVKVNAGLSWAKLRRVCQDNFTIS